MRFVTRDVPLPRGWPEHARAATVLALAKVAALEEEARILRSRLEHVHAARRPHYPPTSRLAILALRAARGWTVAETARRFLLSVQTLANWMHPLDDEGDDALVRIPVPVNRFPDFVRHIVATLERSFPALGKVRVAQLLARAGLHLAVTTVARMRKTARATPPTDDAPAGGSTPGRASVGDRAQRTVTSRYPHHVWNVDLTLVPIVSGFWVPWTPQALVQRWPFCFWLAAVLDHHSRAVVATKVFLSQPSARELLRVLDAARRSSGVTPNYIVSDRGGQCEAEYVAWCRRRGVRPRFGAVGRSRSIAVIERFFRSLKEEMLSRLPIVPMKLARMAREIDAYVVWYNCVS